MAWTLNPNAFTTPVYGPGATKAASWEDLDLSAHIGAVGTYIVKLAIVCTSAHTPYVAVRPDGNPSSFYEVGAGGAAAGQIDNQNKAITLEVTTVASVVEWIASSAIPTFTVYLIGWLDATASVPTGTASGAPSVAGFVYPVAAWPGNTLDLSGVSNDDTLFLFENDHSSGSINRNCAVRAADDSEDTYLAGDITTVPGGLGFFYAGSVTSRNHAVLLPSDPNGAFECQRKVVSWTVDIYVHSYIDTAGGWVRSRNTLYSDVNPPLAWTDLDLSGAVPGSSYAILKFERVSGGAGNCFICVRMNGDALDHYGALGKPGGTQQVFVQQNCAGYVAVPVDASGVIEWITNDNTIGFDVTVMGYVAGSGGPGPSGERGRSTGAMPLGLTGPNPISASLRAAGYLWRDEFLSAYLSARQGLALTGSPSFANGLVLDGATQYGLYAGFPAIQSFSESQQFWIIQFSPDFAADDGNEHVLFDGEDTVTAELTVWGLRKLGAGDSNALRLTVPDLDTDIALATYQAAWVTGGRNTLVVNIGKTGGTEVLLNGTQILSSVLAYTPQSVGNLFLGVDADGVSSFFDGTIHRLAFGLGTLSAADAADLAEAI